MVLVHLPLRAITLLINKPSIQIEVEAEVAATQVVVAAAIKIRIGIITRVKVVEEEDRTLEAGGEVEIKTRVLIEIKIMHLMLNVGHVVSRVTTQMNVQYEGDQIIEVEGEGNKIIMLQQIEIIMMMTGPNNYLSCNIYTNSYDYVNRNT